jgi:3-phosphoshikimate 1-carboxyvinyltransferase
MKRAGHSIYFEGFRRFKAFRKFRFVEMIRLYQPNKHLRGRIALERSKSLSNRALVIRELCGTSFSIEYLSGSADTQTLEKLLALYRDQKKPANEPLSLDAGAGGATFRFLAAFLAFQPGTQILTGNSRMLERPVEPLVDALRSLGARISYAGRPGFPPLRIEEPNWAAYRSDIKISASISSQFISALLMVAPLLPYGLRLQLEEEVVSRPYIDMTLGVMRHFGLESRFLGKEIIVPPGVYRPAPFQVEADWSAASYFYGFAALSDSCDLFLEGLNERSLQGDSILALRMEAFGVKTRFEPGGARLFKKSPCPLPPILAWDFLENPDLAQTISVLCAAVGAQGLFSGLETLRIKETDRISALQKELKKIDVELLEMPDWPGKACFMQEGLAGWKEAPLFSTYGDHRMAMAFSQLALLGPIRIENPEVVEKSYPNFWEDLKSLGFGADQAF